MSGDSSDYGSEHPSEEYSDVEYLQDLPGFERDSFTRTFNWVQSLVGEDGGMEIYFPVFGPAFPTPERTWGEDGGMEISFPLFPAFPMPKKLQETEDPSLFAGNDPPPTLSDGVLSEDGDPDVSRYRMRRSIHAGSIIFPRLFRDYSDNLTQKILHEEEDGNGLVVKIEKVN